MPACQPFAWVMPASVQHWLRRRPRVSDWSHRWLVPLHALQGV